MKESPDAPVRRAAGLRWLEIGLWAFGIVCLAWVLYGWGQARWYQSQAEAELLRLEEAAVLPDEDPIPEAASADEPTGAEGSSSEPEAASLADGSPLGRIVVPSIGVRAVIAKGVEEPTLRRAVGWLSSSAAPGATTGNVALAAHRDSFFRDLGKVRLGDEILVETPEGRSSYRVEWIRVVDPTEMGVVGPTDYPAVTLVTCYPFWWAGPAPERYIVRGRKIDEVAGS